MPRGAIAWLALLLATPSSAQVSGSAAVVSDYRYRGISLSDNRPAVQLAVAYDHADGLYAGILASSARPDPETGDDVQLLPHLGYARRMDNGISWEIGAEYAAFLDASGYDYPELHIGVGSERVNARLFFAHRYFGEDSDAVYVELNGNHPLLDRVRLLGHVGWLHLDTTEQSFPGLQDQHVDLRVGIGIDVGRCDLQVAWVSTDGDEARYLLSPQVDHSTLVVSLSRAW